MKKFQQVKTPTIEKTPMKDRYVNFEQVEKMRIAVYENEDNYVMEVDFHFTEKQDEWDGEKIVKLRNALYKINNIAYKMPSGFELAQDFYDTAVKEARAFKKKHNADLHNKLGRRYPDRYYTIPFLFVSYDPHTKSGILQITNPIFNDDETIDCLSEYQKIDFELNKQGKGMEYVWIE